MIEIERVLILIKPDGVQKAIAGDIIRHFTATDLRMIGLKLVAVSKKQAQAHYVHLKDKFFFNQIVDYLTGALHGGSPVVAMVFEGKDAIKKSRHLAGATNPEEADPKSVRGRYGRVTTKGVYENLVHVSSDEQEAQREINLWFKKSELLKDI